MGCSTSSIPPEYDDSSYFVHQDWRAFKEEFVDVSDSTKTMTNNINLASWIPTKFDVKAVVLIAHGLHEHIMRYHFLADEFTRQGIAVYGPDHHAHGKSYGQRGLIQDYKFITDDFIAVANIVRSKHAPSTPFFLLGHSMGSLVALATCLQISDVKGIIISGCAFVPGVDSASPFGISALYSFGQSSVGASLVPILASLDPNGAAAPIIMQGLTTWTEDYDILKKDSRRHDGAVKNKTACEFNKLKNVASECLALIDYPMLILHGSSDMVTLPCSSEQLFKNIATKDDRKQLILLPRLKHEIFREVLPERKEVLSLAVDFVTRGTVGNFEKLVYGETSVVIDLQDATVDVAGGAPPSSV